MLLTYYYIIFLFILTNLLLILYQYFLIKLLNYFEIDFYYKNKLYFFII